VTTTTSEKMNDITRWKVYGQIVERPKLLIWLENTYKHKERKKKPIREAGV
jgi:hypothetical protein